MGKLNNEKYIKNTEKSKLKSEMIWDIFFTIQLSFLPNFPYHFTFQLTFFRIFDIFFIIQLSHFLYIPYHFTFQLTFFRIFDIFFIIQLSNIENMEERQVE
jgi:uncharacterized membrane protein